MCAYSISRRRRSVPLAVAVEAPLALASSTSRGRCFRSPPDCFKVAVDLTATEADGERLDGGTDGDETDVHVDAVPHSDDVAQQSPVLADAVGCSARLVGAGVE
jgi:hypothetical protein